MSKHRAKRTGWNGGEDDRAFGHAIRLQRKHRKMTLTETAGLLCDGGAPMSEATLARIETGDRPASPAEGLAILALFGLAPGVLPGTEKWAAETAPAALPLPVEHKPAQRPIPAPFAPENSTGGHELARLADAVEELVGVVRTFLAPPAPAKHDDKPLRVV